MAIDLAQLDQLVSGLSDSETDELRRFGRSQDWRETKSSEVSGVWDELGQKRLLLVCRETDGPLVIARLRGPGMACNEIAMHQAAADPSGKVIQMRRLTR